MSNSGPLEAGDQENVGDFGLFSADMITAVVSRLEATSLCRMSQTCRKFHSLCSTDSLWKRLFLETQWDPIVLRALELMYTPRPRYNGASSHFHPDVAPVPDSLFDDVAKGFTGKWKVLYGQASKKDLKLHLNSFSSEVSFKPREEGSFFTKALSWFSSHSSSATVLLSGLDCAGKTTLLYKIRHKGDIVTEIPMIGFNLEKAQLDYFKVVCWDVGGSDKIRRIWDHWLEPCSGIIFVVDSGDYDRISEAYDEFMKFVSIKYLTGVPVLVLANKQDLPSCMTVSEIYAKLGMRLLNAIRQSFDNVLRVDGISIGAVPCIMSINTFLAIVTTFCALALGASFALIGGGLYLILRDIEFVNAVCYSYGSEVFDFSTEDATNFVPEWNVTIMTWDGDWYYNKVGQANSSFENILFPDDVEDYITWAMDAYPGEGIYACWFAPDYIRGYPCSDCDTQEYAFFNYDPDDLESSDLSWGITLLIPGGVGFIATAVGFTVIYKMLFFGQL
ncbi:Small GTPase superfamily, Rab type [Pelomyxa schiedti]|nr:Small GTPase superfamily, Rab type [Pelomyxa schiedti]